MMQRIINRAKELLQNGEVRCVLGLKRGEFFYDQTPAVFTTPEELNELVYDSFSSPNLSKYLIRETQAEGKVLALLKPCDTYSLNQLVAEHRIDRSKVYVLGLPCAGKLDINLIRDQGVKGLLAVKEEGDTVQIETLYGGMSLPRQSVLAERCRCCKALQPVAADEIIESEESGQEEREDRFARVSAIEEMTEEERYAFWRGELSRCIRCNACRNACPACSCVECVFDHADSGVQAKVNTNEFEENLFHIIRALHVAGRCTDCGECARVCPQRIPLQLLNRKLIWDIDRLYGPYQAGAEGAQQNPLTAFDPQDPESGQWVRRDET